MLSKELQIAELAERNGILPNRAFPTNSVWEIEERFGLGPERKHVMFGRMMVTPILQVGRDADLQAAITVLTQAEQAEMVHWIEFPNSVLLFLLVPRDPDSGAVYILDRETGTWYSVDFNDKQYGGYSISQLEELLKECRSLELVERQGLWERGFNWWVKGDKRPETTV